MENIDTVIHGTLRDIMTPVWYAVGTDENHFANCFRRAFPNPQDAPGRVHDLLSGRLDDGPRRDDLLQLLARLDPEAYQAARHGEGALDDDVVSASLVALVDAITRHWPHAAKDVMTRAIGEDTWIEEIIRLPEIYPEWNQTIAGIMTEEQHSNLSAGEMLADIQHAFNKSTDTGIDFEELQNALYDPGIIIALRTLQRRWMPEGSQITPLVNTLRCAVLPVFGKTSQDSRQAIWQLQALILSKPSIPQPFPHQSLPPPDLLEFSATVETHLTDFIRSSFSVSALPPYPSAGTTSHAALIYMTLRLGLPANALLGWLAHPDNKDNPVKQAYQVLSGAITPDPGRLAGRMFLSGVKTLKDLLSPVALRQDVDLSDMAVRFEMSEKHWDNLLHQTPTTLNLLALHDVAADTLHRTLQANWPAGGWAYDLIGTRNKTVRLALDLILTPLARLLNLVYPFNPVEERAVRQRRRDAARRNHNRPYEVFSPLGLPHYLSYRDHADAFRWLTRNRLNYLTWKEAEVPILIDPTALISGFRLRNALRHTWHGAVLSDDWQAWMEMADELRWSPEPADWQSTGANG